MAQNGSAKADAAWPIFRSLASFRPSYLPGDLIAGLTLAAIAIPEQMATARLGGFSPQIGFFAFIAGSLGFAMLGSNRFLSCGADFTITPIFAGGLVLLAASGSPDYQALAVALALMVGVILVAGRPVPSRLDRQSAVDAGDGRLSRRHFRAHPGLADARRARAAVADRTDARQASRCSRSISAKPISIPL